MKVGFFHDSELIGFALERVLLLVVDVVGSIQHHGVVAENHDIVVKAFAFGAVYVYVSLLLTELEQDGRKSISRKCFPVVN